MRVVLAIVIAAGSARALEIEDPSVNYRCRSGKTWNEVEKCLAAEGKVRIVREAPGAKLVRIDQREDTVWVDAGLYLYVERKQTWHAAGSWFGRGSDYEVVAMKPLVVGTHTGFRIDIAQASPIHVRLDDVTSTPAVRRTQQTLFCGGLSSWCTQIVHACEVLVRGRAYWAFRGAPKLDGNQISIPGDRRLAGPFCTQAERVFLGWPQTTP